MPERSFDNGRIVRNPREDRIAVGPTDIAAAIWSSRSIEDDLEKRIGMGGGTQIGDQSEISHRIQRPNVLRNAGAGDRETRQRTGVESIGAVAAECDTTDAHFRWRIE